MGTHKTSVNKAKEEMELKLMLAFFLLFLYVNGVWEEKSLSPDSQNAPERLENFVKSRFFFSAVKGECAISG